MTTTQQPLSQSEIERLEAELDPEMSFRPLLPWTAWLVAGLLLALSFFHYYTAGFGLLPETTHRGIHMAFVVGLIAAIVGASARPKADAQPAGFAAA